MGLLRKVPIGSTFQSLLKPKRHNPQKLNMPKGSGLTKPMKLSAELADIVGKKEASRAECIKQLWAYIKKNNLQDPENKQFFNPDKQEWPPKNLRGCLWNNGLHAKLLWMPTLLLITTQRGLKQIEPSFKS